MVDKMAAIRIQTEETVIPVIIGEVELEFKADDDSLNLIMDAVEKFNEKGDKLDKKIKDEELDYKEEFEVTKDFARESMDYLLGEGAFDKMYEQTPSLKLVIKYFLEIAESLKVELEAQGIDTDQNEKMKKYIKDSKPKTKKK